MALNLQDFTATESITVAVPQDFLYRLVSDITRTGSWSPVVEKCWWEDPETAGQVGAWFFGRNVTPNRTWETKSQVTVAKPNEEFGWAVGGNIVRWGYKLAALTPELTTLTEYWEVTPAGEQFFRNKYADDAETQLYDRREAALTGIPETLNAIKHIAEQEYEKPQA